MISKLRKRWGKWLGLRLARLIRAAEADLEDASLPAFGTAGENLRVQAPWRISNAKHISLGSNITLGPGCMINAICRYPGRFLSDVPHDTQSREYNPSIVIGDRVSVTGYLGLSAVQSVTIEDDVIIASHVFISDNAHGRSRVDIPYKYQPLEDISPVLIGRGSWLGEHAVIMPGVQVGEFSIVGANSVVTRDVPPRSIVAGAPAKVIRQWSDEKSAWVSPNISPGTP